MQRWDSPAGAGQGLEEGREMSTAVGQRTRIHFGFALSAFEAMNDWQLEACFPGVPLAQVKVYLGKARRRGWDTICTACPSVDSKGRCPGHSVG